MISLQRGKRKQKPGNFKNGEHIILNRLSHSQRRNNVFFFKFDLYYTGFFPLRYTFDHINIIKTITSGSYLVVIYHVFIKNLKTICKQLVTFIVITVGGVIAIQFLVHKYYLYFVSLY